MATQAFELERTAGQLPATATRAQGAWLALLSVPGFLRLCAGNGLALSGMRLQGIIIAWLVLDMTGSRMWLGIVNGAPAIAVIAFSLLGGVLADSPHAARTLLWTRLALASVMFLGGVLVTTGQVQVAFLLAVVLVSVAATAVDMPIGRTLVVDMVGAARSLSGTAASTMAMNIMAFVGPVVIGVVIGRLGVDAALYLMAGSYFGAALLVPRFERAAATGAANPLADIRAGFAYLRRTPRSAWLVSLAFLVPLAGVYFAMVPVFARDVLHVGPGGLGLIMGVYGVGSILGSGYLVANGQMQRRGLKLGVLGFVFAAGMAGFALIPVLVVSCAIAFVMGVTASLWQNTLSAMVQTSVEPEMKGRVMSVCTMGFQLMSLGWLLGGGLASAFGVAVAILVAAVAFGAFNLLAFVRSPELRQMD